jgi:hypothetical protein
MHCRERNFAKVPSLKAGYTVVKGTKVVNPKAGCIAGKGTLQSCQPRGRLHCGRRNFIKFPIQKQAALRENELRKSCKACKNS